MVCPGTLLPYSADFQITADDSFRSARLGQAVTGLIGKRGLEIIEISYESGRIIRIIFFPEHIENIELQAKICTCSSN
jgi:hypothetical protein